MPKSYRIRTEVGKDKAIQVSLEQDFEHLEILSLKILQTDIYTRVCSDYGVVVGRITANNGLGLPNCKVSIFIPLSPEDENNAIISELYPYKSLNDTNDEGYRYNLLPYTKSHGGHTPTGTFPTRNDILTNPSLIEVYDKYYKFTVKTNDSGDFMIFGVPLGTQTIHVDVDLSDIGEFSMTPQDIVRIGLATENQVSGTQFKASNSLGELPQLLQFNRIIEVLPLWGQPEICTLGITRTDFDLTEEAAITLQPSAVFMGSIISNQEKRALKKRCKVNRKLGNLCTLIAGPGEILSIRQTIGIDSDGLPVLEEYTIGEGGKVIDDNGTWMVDLPMNLEFVYTNEFGERTFSSDPKKGVPTKAKYRFRIKWEQPPTLTGPVKRGDFLVPNIKEWGWDYNNPSSNDPYTVDDTDYTGCRAPNPNDWNSAEYKRVAASYAFSLSWKEYGETDSSGNLTTVGERMVQEAVSCEDRFFEFSYNKVYTVSQLISEYRSGAGNKRFIAIRDILDETCESTNNPFPFNDGQFQFDIIYLLFTILALIAKPILVAVIFIKHLIAWMVCAIAQFICSSTLLRGRDNWRCNKWNERCQNQVILLPALTYPDCEMCECAAEPDPQPITGGLTNTFPINSESLVQTLSYSGASYTGLTSSLSGITIVPTVNFLPNSNTGAQSTNFRSFSHSIPFSEKINLFNTKAKYFDNNDILNPGGGVNRIKVKFNIQDNGGPSQYHFDNVVAMLFVPDVAFDLNQGDLLSFAKENSVTDPNLKVFTGLSINGLNQFGTESITGTPVGNPISILDPNGVPATLYQSITTLNYANFQLGNNINGVRSVTYNLFTQPDDGSYCKFPMDQEYFQIIYSGRVSDFISQCNNQINAPNSFAHRFLNGEVKVISNEFDGASPYGLEQMQTTTMTPLNSIGDYANYIVTFMVRGVDPHSTRCQCSYDLSALFGYTLTDNNAFNPNYTQTFSAKLNIPIQPGMKNVRHNITSSDLTDTYSQSKLYFDSFSFKPDPTLFIPFTSTKPSFYSRLDSSENCDSWNTQYDSVNNLQQTPYNGYVINVNEDNDYSRELWWTDTTAPIIPLGFGANAISPYLIYYNPTLTVPSQLNGIENRFNTPNNGRNRGYFRNEIVEGGVLLSIVDGSGGQRFDVTNVGAYLSIVGGAPTKNDTFSSFYYSQRYPETGMSMVLGSSGYQTVMRSDRLPMSNTPFDDSADNFVPSPPYYDVSYALTSNPNLSLRPVSDSGYTLNVTAGTPTAITQGETSDNQADLDSISATSGVSSTFSCNGWTPLECYYVDGNGFVRTQPPSHPCYTNSGWGGYGGADGSRIIQFGCYKLITDPWESRKVDQYLMNEWLLRLRVNFAACRNVFGHIFTNQWVNGTLFMYPFQNDTKYTSPNGNDPLGANQPYSCICKHQIFVDPRVNAFYYRVAPYNESLGFIGREGRGFNGNERLLNNPTTIMDLGPVNDYMDELSYSDDFQGYVVNRLDTTSFQEVDELLNLFITSRLVSNSIRETIRQSASLNVLNDPVKKYFSRDNNKIDGDYAQMGAINSQIGVIPYDSTVYTDPNDVFFNRADANNNVFGIAYSANTQIRDWITPKRNIVSPQGDPSFTCTFDEFPIFSQDIPMYLWKIKPNVESNEDSIFGDQQNEWFTTTVPLSTELNHYRYQSIDRIDTSTPIGSRTMVPTDGSSQDNFKGYIYNVVSGQVDFSYPNNSPTTQPTDRIINNTAPFYFYFGLIKGSSSFDRFLTKWVKSKNNSF